MKFVFMPISIIGGLLAGVITKQIFEFVWGRISKEEAPEAEHREISWAPLLAALAVEGAIFKVTRGLVDHGSRIAFERATGTWPGEEAPDRK
jgi:Protein of unknown function (DUF4235)